MIYHFCDRIAPYSKFDKNNSTIMTTQELKWAQKDVYDAGRKLATAGLRLGDTRYEAQYRKAWNALNKLNQMLIKDINK